jgi:hypothetical protein
MSARERRGENGVAEQDMSAGDIGDNEKRNILHVKVSLK